MAAPSKPWLTLRDIGANLFFFNSSGDQGHGVFLGDTMDIFIREQLWHAYDNTLLSLQIGRYRERFWINDHQTWQNGFKGL